MRPLDRPFRIEFAGDLDSQRGELLSGRDFRLDIDAPHRFFIGDPSPRCSSICSESAWRSIWWTDSYGVAGIEGGRGGGISRSGSRCST